MATICYDPTGMTTLYTVMGPIYVVFLSRAFGIAGSAFEGYSGSRLAFTSLWYLF